MPITQELYRLGNSARRLNDSSDQLNRSLAAIDGLLGRLMIGLDYVHPRPLAEHVTFDHAGKRVIELCYVGYFRVKGDYHLAIKTVKVLESKLQMATQTPGEIKALLEAPRQLRYRAVDLLPEVVAGLAEQVDDMLANMDRRRQIAEGLVAHLEQIAGGPLPEADVAQAAQSATSHRRPTVRPTAG